MTAPAPPGPDPRTEEDRAMNPTPATDDSVEQRSFTSFEEELGGERNNPIVF